MQVLLIAGTALGARQPVFDFHARVPPLGAARGRADPRLLHGPDGNAGISLSARNQRGSQVGLAPTERRSALLGL